MTTIETTTPPGTGRIHRVVGGARLRPSNLLYIEDSAAITEMVSIVLRDRPHINMESASTGARGVAAAHERRPDLILLDLRLPDVDGMTVLDRLHAHHDTSHIPIVVVTGSVMGEQLSAALSAGARECISKPFAISRLLNVVDCYIPT